MAPTTHTHRRSVTAFAGAAVVIALFTPHTMALAIEEPTFQVVQTLPDGVEVREYAAYVVAEIVVPGPADEAGSRGFRPLASYIFGNNKGDRKLAMTAPVMQASAPSTIAMAAPVSQAATDGGYAVQFVMPAGSALDTLPEPNDARIHFKELPGARYGVIRYSGFWTDGNYERHLDTLRKGLEAAGLQTTGEPIYARYDAPWTPWFMRRNEVWLRLP